jgi:hypothetical protein
MQRLLLVTSGLLAACSTQATGGRIEPGPVPEHVAVAADGQQATFAAAGSPAIAQAAMVYPAAAAEQPAPPMSLTASDGTGLALVDLDGRAVIDGPVAFTELRMTFENPRDRVIEGRFAITLPTGAAISRLAMKIDGRWQEAEVVERQLARRAYEDFLHRQQDPALLEKEAGNEFRARIFPIPARGQKQIIVSFSHQLASAEEPYVLPLRGLPEIRSLRLSALRGSAAAGKSIAYQPTTFERTSFVPDRDFEVAQAGAVPGIAAGELAIVRVSPEVPDSAAPIASARILVDTSASRAPGFAGQVKRLGELIAALAEAHDGMTVEVAAFDSTVQAIYRGPAAGFGAADLDAIRARRPLGASNLHGALGWAATRPAADRLVIVTDAVATAGAEEAGELRRAARAIGAGRIDVVLVGGIRDDATALALARGNAAADGAVIDGSQPVAAVARRLGQATLSGVTVAVAGAEMVWPRQLDGVQPGDDYLVAVALARPAGASLTVDLGGPAPQKLAVPLARAERPLVARAVAGARIAALTADRDALPADDATRREALKKQIVELSTRHRVMSDFTALLVLETEADYQRFGIDRNALSDILTVGPNGVVATGRTDLVLIAKPPAKQRKDYRADKKKGKKEAEKSLEGIDLGEADGKLEYEPADTDGLVAGDDDDADGEADDREATASNRPAGPAPAERRPPPPPSPEPASETTADELAADAPAPVAQEPAKPSGPPALTGKMAAIAALIAAGDHDRAVVDALSWQSEEPGDVMALVALGDALAARGQTALAARAYGSIIDLFPSRADMRRMAAQRLEALGSDGSLLAADSLAKAVAQRPDHLTGHRQLAYALYRAGRIGEAFAAIEAGLARRYPSGRFAGGTRILRDDLGILGAAWLAREPGKRAEIARRLAAAGADLATRPSTRFVLSWETDANDVDFHIYDRNDNHAFFSHKQLATGGALFEDVTTGYGPECFAIDGPMPAAPYRLMIHYYSRGPMGYGMGELEILRHDGNGGLAVETRPFVVMSDGAYVELGTVE